MFDLSKEFEKFYRKKIVLPAVIQNDLRKMKDININRLKDGLIEYNNDNRKYYKISEIRTQGSMAMHTVVGNDENDFDIDVAIVFEKDNLGNLGPLATRNVVANALKKKTKQFNVEPEVKTSCVRIHYSEGYHVDFAIFRRYKDNEFDDEYKYEHAGSEWTERGIQAIEDWFKKENSVKENDLRKIIRFSKMFTKSRDSWINMPSGLVQTLLCSEQYVTCSRIDEIFYYTMKNIVNRLENHVEMNAPVDNNRALVTRDIDKIRMENLKNRLKDQLEKLNILFDNDCSYSDAVSVWGTFFKHKYWDELLDNYYNKRHDEVEYNDTEQFIEELYIVDEMYKVELECTVMGNGFSKMAINNFLDKYTFKFKGFIPKNFSVQCGIKSTNVPSYDKVLWKVRNLGHEAEKRNDIRGQILEREKRISENTMFKGNHFIECYLINGNTCIGIGHVQIPIGVDSLGV